MKYVANGMVHCNTSYLKQLLCTREFIICFRWPHRYRKVYSVFAYTQIVIHISIFYCCVLFSLFFPFSNWRNSIFSIMSMPSYIVIATDHIFMQTKLRPSNVAQCNGLQHHFRRWKISSLVFTTWIKYSHDNNFSLFCCMMWPVTEGIFSGEFNILYL